MNTNKKGGDRYQLPPRAKNGSGKSDSLKASYHNCQDWSKNAERPAITGDVAVRYRSASGSYIVGKVLYVGSRRVFFTRVKQSDLLRTLDAWSIAPEVVDVLELLGVTVVDYFYSDTNTLYTIDIATIRRRGILKSMHSGIGRRFHVPRAFWRTTHLTYNVPFVEEEIEVTATPLPRQGNLFEGVAT